MQTLVPLMRRLAAALLLLTATAMPASAQQVALSMRDGLVTLDARNATVRQILAEWAKVGRVTVVNAEKVTGPPVTLQLPGLPERQALDIILRGVAGYMVGARQGSTPLEPSMARYDRVLILATSTAAAAPPPQAARTTQPGGLSAGGPATRPPGLAQLPQPDADGDSDNDGVQDSAQPGGRVIPAGGTAPLMPQGGPGLNRVPMGGFPPPMTTPPGTPQQVPAGQSAPANPFGVTVGSGAPGVVVPAPQPTTGPGGTPATR